MTPDAWRDVQAMPETARLSARLNLYRFLDLAESWSPLEGRPSLPAFVAYLDLMEEEDIEELDTARISNDDAVTLLTVHRAKGLEWEAVFIPACSKWNFPSKVRLLEDPFTKAEVLPYGLRLDREDLPAITADMTTEERKVPLRQRHADQEWRLAYVATTRARRHLFASGAAWTGTPVPNKRPAEPSALLEAIASSDVTERGHWAADPGERPDRIRLETMEASPDPLFPGGWDVGLQTIIGEPAVAAEMAQNLGLSAAYDAGVSLNQEMLFALADAEVEPPEPEPLRTSVTALVTYATCPKRYYWSEVDRLPRRASHAARRGVELHRRIEMHHRGAIPFDDLDEELYDVVPAESEGANETKSAFATFSQSRFAATAPVLIEAPFDLRFQDGARIRGRIDAVYRHGAGRWEIVDFKSGRPARNPAAMIQLEAYAIAAHDTDLIAGSVDQLDVTFAYLGDGLTERRESVSDEWLDGARSRLTLLVGSIESELFDAQPSLACENCDFLKFCEEGREWREAQG